MDEKILLNLAGQGGGDNHDVHLAGEWNSYLFRAPSTKYSIYMEKDYSKYLPDMERRKLSNISL